MSNLRSSLLQIADGYGDPVHIVDGYFGTFIDSGTVNTNLFDGYGDPIGSTGGALNVNITDATLDVNVDPDSYTHDGYGNPVGSTGGSLNVFVADPVIIEDGGGSISVDDGGGSITVDGAVDSNLFDGYGNPLGSEAGSLNVNVTDDFIPVTQGEGDFYSDQDIQILATSPSFTTFSFGFTSQGIIISHNDIASGDRGIEFSFDNFATVHGTLSKGQTLTMDHRRRTSIQMRATGISPEERQYRLIVWG